MFVGIVCICCWWNISSFDVKWLRSADSSLGTLQRFLTSQMATDFVFTIIGYKAPAPFESNWCICCLASPVNLRWFLCGFCDVLSWPLSQYEFLVEVFVLVVAVYGSFLVNWFIYFMFVTLGASCLKILVFLLLVEMFFDVECVLYAIYQLGTRVILSWVLLCSCVWGL